MTMTGEKRLYDYLGSFPRGINSSIDPLLLPKEQLAFLSNATNRGDLIKQRPNFNNLTLTYINTVQSGTIVITAAACQAAFQAGLYQGWCYFNPAPGLEYLMVVVAGKMFRISVSTNTATVMQVALPDSGNSPTTPVHWLWASERWLTWNDGIALPMYYDGNTARRSLGTSANGGRPLATLAADFTIPSSGQRVYGDAQLTGPWNDYLGNPLPTSGITVLVNNAVYYLKSAYSKTGQSQQSAGGYASATLQRITGAYSAGDALAPKAILQLNNQIQGCILSAVNENGAIVSVWPAGTPAAGVQFTLNPSGGGSNLYNASNWGCLGGTTWQLSNATKLELAAGDVIQVPAQFGGIFIKNAPCIVVSFTYSTTGKITSMLVSPADNSCQGYLINITNTSPTPPIVQPNSHVVPVSGTDFSTTCNGTLRTYSNANSATGQDSTHWTSPTPNMPQGPIQHLITLTLTQNFTGNVGDVLQMTLPSTSLASMTVVSFNGNKVTCRMNNDSVAGQSVPTIASATTLPTNAAHILLDVTASGSLTTVASYPPTDGAITPTTNAKYLLAASMAFPNAVIPASGLLVSPSPNSIQPYMIVQVTNPGGTSYGGTGDLLFVTAIGSLSGSATQYGATTYWLELINQTDTPGNTEFQGSSIYAIPELPVGRRGVYAQGRNWMELADGQSFIAGDLVGASSGSLANNYLDAVLKVSMNQQLAGGGTFRLPGCGTQIRAMGFIPTLDVSLGQGPVQILTQNTVFSCNAPVDMTTWATVTSPIVTVSLIGSGAVSQDSIVTENCDLFFRTPEGFIRSLVLARLDFNQWGNTPASEEVVRSLQNDNSALLMYDSNVVFNNRLLAACQPFALPRGIVHAAMVSLNFDPLSTIQDKQPATWEGEWSGIDILGLKTGFFSSVERCFALCLDNATAQIELHEILQDGAAINDNGSTQVSWFAEFPMQFKDKPTGPRAYKRLINGEFSISEIQSDVEYQWYYKSDQYPAWVPWYSGTITYQTNDPGFRGRIGIGMPNPKVFDPTNNRPLREGYNFQAKVVFTGYCKFMGARFAADEIPEPEFAQPK